MTATPPPPTRPLYPRSLRWKVELTGEVQPVEGASFAVHVIDLSLEGAFVETDEQLEPGAAVALTLDLPGEVMTVEASVVRVDTTLRDAPHPELDALVVRAPGLGLRFHSVRSRDLRKIRTLLERARFA